MSTCEILNEPFVLARGFIKEQDYSKLALKLLNSKESGHYYDLEKTAKVMEQYILKKKGEEIPFSSKKFVKVAQSIFNKRKVLSSTPFFNKELLELYKNSPEAMSYMTNGFEKKLIRLAFVDPEKKTVTLDASSLNSNIQEYKNDLFKTIFDYVKTKKASDYKDVEYSPLYIDKLFNKDGNYQKVLSDLGEIFEKENYSTNVSINDPKELLTLDVYNAAVILSNFDSLIEDRFNNIVSINQSNFGALNNPIGNPHYFIEFKGINTEFWKESSHEAEGIEKYASNFIKAIAATIPLLDVNGKPRNNMYLGINNINLIGVLVKELNDEGTLASFQKDPKGNLKKFLSHLKTNGKLSYRDKIDSLYNYLYHPRTGVVGLIESTKAANQNISSKIIDIEAIIAHQLNNVAAPTYGVYSTDPKEEKKLLSLVKRDLQGDEVKKNILDQIIQNKNMYSIVEVSKDSVILKGGVEEVDVNKIVIPGQNTIRLIKDLTGIEITSNFTKLLGSTQAGKRYSENIVGKSFAALLTIGSKIAKEVDSPNVDKNYLLKLLNDTNVVDIITAVIGDISPEANMTLKNTVGDNIPTVKQSNIAHEWNSVVSIAIEEYGSAASDVLFLKYPNLFKGTETVLEVETDEQKAVSALYLNPEENLYLSFVENYITPMSFSTEEVNANGKYLSFKTVNYSDKSTILNQLIDQDLDIDGKGSLRSMKLQDLKNLNRKYINNYYGHLIDKISKNYSNLIYYDEAGNVKKYLPNILKASPLDAVKSINSFLEKNGKKINSIILDSWKYVEEQKKEGKLPKDYEFQFTDEVSYSKYEDGIKFNKVIEYYYTASMEKNPNITSVTSMAEKLFVNKLLEIKPNIPANQLLGGKIGNSVTKKKVETLYENLGLEIGNWVTFDKNSLGKFIYFTYEKDGVTQYGYDLTEEYPKELKNLKLNPLLSKWLHTQNLVRYNYLGLTTKHEYQHPHKLGKKSAGISIYDDSIISEITGRSISMTKRMVIHPATMEYFLQGLQEGIPPKIKLAVVSDLSSLSYNFNGTSKEHDAWDGSLAANPFLTYFLKNSFPAKGISDVQKIIGTHSTDTHSVFLKCALFTFTNEMIRKSAKSKVNLDTLMKAMNNIDIEEDIDLTRNSLNNNSIDIDQIIPDGIYFSMGGNTYKVNKLIKEEGKKYLVQVTNIDTFESKEFSKTINNLYDLWQVFGGAYSKTMQHGQLVYSDASIEAVGTIMSITADGKLKDKMIGILAQKSSVKNGATNVNSASQLTAENPTLMHSTINSNFIGIQLDANHISDDSVVNEISQVISALAENQSTPELYSELYRAIGQIISSELDRFKKANSDKKTGKFNLDLVVKSYIDTLKKSEQIGNANEILDLLDKIMDEKVPIEGEETKTTKVPISNNNFFKGFAINVISKLSSDFIKRKYPGLAAVLNPSYGTVQVYEAEDGTPYFADDLLDLATPEERVEDFRGGINSSNSKTIENVINRMFINKPITVGEIKPLDTIIADGVQYDLKDISEYYRVKELLKNATEIIKVTNKPRDLKPVEITFTQNGISKNIFDNDPIRLTWSYQNAINTKQFVNPNDEVILRNFVNYFAAKDGMVITDLFGKVEQSYIKGKLKLWNKRSFELLAEKLNYAVVTPETVFADLFADDDFTSKLDTSVFNRTPLETVENYNHKPAEIIMPKVYRSEFEIGNDSFSKIASQKQEYFKAQLNKVLEPDTTHCDLFVTDTKGNHTYINILSKEDLKMRLSSGEYEIEKVYTKEIDGTRWRVDIKGQKMYKFPYGTSIVTDIAGNELMIFDKKEDLNKVLGNIEKFVSSSKAFLVYPFSKLNPDLYGRFLEISRRRSSPNIATLLKELTLEGKSDAYFELIKQNILEQTANGLYVSWQKSNDLIAARIPSQAMQSFMSMKTIGYNEDPGNNVFVSHWQIWLQGSDFKQYWSHYNKSR